MKLKIFLGDSLHRTLGCSYELFNISGLGVIFLTAYQFSYALDILLHSEFSAGFLPKISNRTDPTFSLFIRKLYKYVLHPIPFLDKGV